MKMFLIGLLVAYLICGLILTLGDAGAFSEDIAMTIVAFPFFAFFRILGYISDYFRYRNLRSIVYDCGKEQWFYCDRKQFDEIDGKLKNFPEYDHEKWREAKKQFDAENIKYWNKQYINDGWTYPCVNHRYAPKIVWKKLEKITLEDI